MSIEACGRTHIPSRLWSGGNITDNNQYRIAQRLFAEKRFAEAFVKYEELAAAGDPHCQVFVGWMCNDGIGTQRDQKKALEWFLRAANLGSKEGAFYCGKLAVVTGEYDEAIVWFQKSAAREYGPALLWLGLAHLRGLGVKTDTKKGVSYLKRAAGVGNIPARRELAVLMIKGKLGISKIPVGFILFLYTLITALISGVTEGNSEKLAG